MVLSSPSVQIELGRSKGDLPGAHILTRVLTPTAPGPPRRTHLVGLAKIWATPCSGTSSWPRACLACVRQGPF